MVAAPPAQLRVEMRDAASLFDDDTVPVFPHKGRLVNESLADYLLSRVREHRKAPSAEVTIVLGTPPLATQEEEQMRAQIREHFAAEAQVAAIESRVNRTEGHGFAWYAVPFVFGAALIAYLFYAVLSVIPAFLLGLVYVLFITVVWLMLWDPIEKLLFDGYFIVLKEKALTKLANSTIRFAYQPVPSR